MRVPWLGDVLRAAGLEVVQVGEPRGRGREMYSVYGVVVHDTVTTTDWSDERVDRLLRDGRSDLPGPLSQLGLDRLGRFRWIADGRSNHNGYGTWGNNAIGIEVYCAGGLKGREETWNARQREAVVAGTRAILDRLDLGASSYWNPRVAGHKETDPDRKIDPYKIDMNRLRADVASPPSEEDDMNALPLVKLPDGTNDDRIWVVYPGLGRAHVQSWQWKLLPDPRDSSEKTVKRLPASHQVWDMPVLDGLPTVSHTHTVEGTAK